MDDIEDMGLEVRSRGQSSFHVKLRSRAPRTSGDRPLDYRPTSVVDPLEQSAGLSGLFCGGGGNDCGGSDDGNEVDSSQFSAPCGVENCCKSAVNAHNTTIPFSQLSNGKPFTIKGEAEELASDLPWRHAVYLRTWGCSHNNSDSEYMAGLLQRTGYTITTNRTEAAVWLLNSCTVKTPSQAQLFNQIRDAQSSGKRVVVAGCVSQAAPSTPQLKGISIVGVQQIDRIVEVVDETMRGNVVRLFSQRRVARINEAGGEKTLPLDLPKVRRNEFIEILAINSGCLNHCTYCKTKQARGDLRSFALDSLVKRARHALVEERCRELWLTSEDLGAWGHDIGLTLPDLLQELVKVIPNDCMMRLGMTNPPYILDYLEEIAEVLRHPRVYAFLHIPVQAGSDAVLGEMRREYTREHFCRIMDYMLENVPNVYIATDFICAFPTESEVDFEESKSLLQKYQFPSVFINQFYPRPGTPAARLKPIKNGEARRRTGEMHKIFRSYTRYGAERIGNVERVLICEMATDGVHYVGHNKSYEHILVEPPAEGTSLLGRWAEVRIANVSKFYMKAHVVGSSTERQSFSPSSTVVESALPSVCQRLAVSLRNVGPATRAIIGSQLVLLLYLLVKFLITIFSY